MTGFATAAVAGARPLSPLSPLTTVLSQRSVVPLQELERQAIEHALEYTRGDRATAAQLLGIGRTTLYRKLKEYRLE
jgi:DNA-binding NtrC family response regulator